MLRCTRLLYFGEHTSCYVAHVFCTSVNTLHVRLHTSFVLRWGHFMLRCTCLLYFGEHTSCYVAYVFCTSVNFCNDHDICQGLAMAVHSIGMQMSATLLPGLSASWCEEKRSAGPVAKHKTIQETFFGGVLHAVLNSHCNNNKMFHKSQGKWSTKRNHHECKHVASAKISTRWKTKRSFFKKTWWNRWANFRAVRMILSLLNEQHGIFTSNTFQNHPLAKQDRIKQIMFKFGLYPSCCCFRIVDRVVSHSLLRGQRNFDQTDT